MDIKDINELLENVAQMLYDKAALAERGSDRCGYGNGFAKTRYNAQSGAFCAAAEAVREMKETC